MDSSPVGTDAFQSPFAGLPSAKRTDLASLYKLTPWSNVSHNNCEWPASTVDHS